MLSIWVALLVRPTRHVVLHLRGFLLCVQDEKDEQQLKRIRDARKSSTLNMITLLSGLPEARKELDEIASKSKALSKDT